MIDLIPMNVLRAGQSGLIDSVQGGEDEVHRLKEMGLTAGRFVQMLQPGEPCIVRLDGTRLCFRPCDALSVLVRLEEVS